MKFDIRRVRDIKTKEIPSEMEQWVPDTGPQLRHLIWSNVDVRSGTYEEKDGSIRKLTWKEISKINREDLLFDINASDYCIYGRILRYTKKESK